MRLLQSFAVIFLASFLLAACGGDTSSGGSGTTDPGTDPGTVPGTTTVTSTSILYTGKTGAEGSYHVLNTALSVLDENGAPIANLDGGDFKIVSGGVDYEDHRHVQKLDYLTQVTGSLVLMLDTSNDMAPHFSELQTAAKRLVDQAVAINLPVTVYEFNIQGSADPLALVGGTVATNVASATTVKAAIDLLTPQPGNTFFYESIATIVADRLTNFPNTTVYDHANTAVAPTSDVELMVIMSDGRESPGTTNTATDVTTLSDGRYWILSIAVGDNPDVNALDGVSTYSATTVPTGGTYSDAVDELMTFVGNYYNGFYLVEYQVTDLTSPTATYDIKLIDGSNKVTVGYDGSLLPTAWLSPICCDLWVGAGFGVNSSAVTLNATLGNTMDFQVVQRWSNLLNTGSNVTWTLSGNLTGQQDATDPTKYTITTTGNTGSASLTVDVVGGTPSPWSMTIPITMN